MLTKMFSFKSAWVENHKGATLSIKKLYIANSESRVYTKRRTSFYDTNASNKCTIHMGRYIDGWRVMCIVDTAAAGLIMCTHCIVCIENLTNSDCWPSWLPTIHHHLTEIKSSDSLSRFSADDCCGNIHHDEILRHPIKWNLLFSRMLALPSTYSYDFESHIGDIPIDVWHWRTQLLDY